MTLPTLYIHIPFCHSKCAYCDFYSVPRVRLTDDFVDALCNELSVRSREWGGRFYTVYIGGGTPSSLSDEQLDRIITALPHGSFDEFTIEVNPEDVSRERAGHWLDVGIGRVSMGIQSFDDVTLSLIGRRHDAARAVDAFTDLREAGFQNISCDLIYGLPGQTTAAWRESVNRLLTLAPEHISAYLLSYEPGTRLSAMLRAGKVRECEADVAQEMYTYLVESTRKAGYDHYEISNFALPGKKAVHNSRYWDSTPYLGIGPGAHGFDGCTRFSNRSDLKAYIAGGGLESLEREDESVDELYNDVVFTALRTARGLSVDEIERRFGVDYRRLCEDAAQPYLNSGVMTLRDGRLVIAESEWLSSNPVIVDFLAV